MSRWQQAEEVAAARLSAAGLTILGRNVRVGHLEIDILALEGDLAVVVEVRHRGHTSYVGAFASVDARKQGRLRTAAERLWASRFRDEARIRAVRFDVVSVTLTEGQEPAVEHVRGAFSTSWSDGLRSDTATEDRDRSSPDR